jgi:hypothetical protein
MCAENGGYGKNNVGGIKFFLFYPTDAQLNIPRKMLNLH